jgi:hypothetical protein
MNFMNRNKIALFSLFIILALSTAAFGDSVFVKASVSPKKGGVISPSGKVTADYGENVQFTITPNTGYEIKDVLVDGISQGAINIYTFTNLIQRHSIKAKFAKKTFTVAIAEGGKVSVSPVGKKTVQYGKKISLKIKPESEDVVPILLVNGQPVEAKKSGKIYKYVLIPSGDTSVYATSEVEPVLTVTTKVLDEETAQNFSSISEDGSALTFNGITPYLESLQPGDVIMSGVTEATPYGLLRKVTNITINGSQVTVETTQATLEDVLEEGEFIINKELTISDTTPFIPLKEGVTLQEIPGPLAQYCLDLHQVLWDGDDNLNTTIDQVVVNGALCFDAKFNFSLGVGVHNYVIPYVKNLTISTTLGQSTALSFESNYSWSFSKEIPIVTMYFGVVTAGPLVFTPKLTVYAGIDAALVAGMTYGATQGNSLTLGVSYSDSNGWIPIADHTSTFQVDSRPVFYAKATAIGYAALSFDFLLYGVAGTYTKPKAYLGLDLDPFGNPWLNIYAGISASAGVKAEIFGYGFNKGFDLFDYRESILTLAGNKPPMITSLTASPKQVPRGGTSTIAVVASDPENDPFTCSWSTSGGTLSSNVGCGSVTWTAPLTPGSYTVSVSVADNKTEYAPSTKAVTLGVQPMWTLTVENSGSGSGRVTGYGGIDCSTVATPRDICSASFPGERTVTLTATPNRGSTFTSWSGCDSTINGYMCEVTVDQNKTVTATFTAQRYALSVQKSGSGSGTVTGTGINCGIDCSENLTGTVTLTATPSSDSEIWNWSGCDSINGDTGNTCTVFMDSNKTVTAIFSARYALSVQKSGDGSGTVTGTGINCGLDCSEVFLAESNPTSRTVTLTAAPSNGSRLTSWSGCDSINGNTCTVTVNQNKNVTAIFSAIYTLSVQRAGSGSGTVTGPGIGCGSDCSESLDYGTALTLTAAPSNGSRLTSWSGCDSINGNTCTVTVNQNKTVTATFTLNKYTLSVQRAGSGSGTVTGPGIGCGSDCSESLDYGTALTLTAAPSSGSTLTSWSGCDSINGNTCTVTVNQNKTVTATFTLNVPQYTLSVQKAGSGSGTVTGGGINCGSTCSVTLAGGTSVTLTANPNLNNSLTSWSGCDSTNGNTCTFTMNRNKTVTATFTLQYYQLSVQKGGCGTGTVTGGGINCGSTCSVTLAAGTSVTLAATPDSGSVFARFYRGTSHLSSNTWTVSDNQTVTALFGLQASNVCVQPAGNGSGRVNGQVYSHSTYNCYLYSDGTIGGTCSSNWPTTGHYYATLYANPYQGSRFDGWTGPCNRTGQNSSGYWCETIWVGQDGWPFEAFVATFTKY